MTFDQVMAQVNGTLKVSREKVRCAVRKFRREYPNADITVMNGTVRASAQRSGNRYACMVCGRLMTSRVNQYFKNGEWVLKKRNDRISNWECPTCKPGVGGRPLATFIECYEDLSGD